MLIEHERQRSVERLARDHHLDGALVALIDGVTGAGGEFAGWCETSSAFRAGDHERIIRDPPEFWKFILTRHPKCTTIRTSNEF